LLRAKQLLFQNFIGDIVANGHCSPAAAARFRLSWIVFARHAKKSPDLARSLHAIVVKPQKVSQCCRIVSSRFAGIPFSSSNINESGVPQVLTAGNKQRESRKPAQVAGFISDRGRFQIGMVAGINRNPGRIESEFAELNMLKH